MTQSKDETLGIFNITDDCDVDNNIYIDTTMDTVSVSSGLTSNNTITLTNPSNNSDYTFTLNDDTISFDNITTTSIPSQEWIDHLPAMSVVQDMCKHYPALKKALENFRTVYKMVEQDYKGNHQNNDLW